MIFTLSLFESPLIPHKFIGNRVEGRFEKILIVAFSRFVFADTALYLDFVSCQFLADKVELRLKGTILYLFQVLPVGLLLPLILPFFALFDEIHLNRHIALFPALCNDFAYLIQLRAVR